MWVFVLIKCALSRVILPKLCVQHIQSHLHSTSLNCSQCWNNFETSTTCSNCWSSHEILSCGVTPWIDWKQFCEHVIAVLTIIQEESFRAYPIGPRAELFNESFIAIFESLSQLNLKIDVLNLITHPNAEIGVPIQSKFQEHSSHKGVQIQN